MKDSRIVLAGLCAFACLSGAWAEPVTGNTILSFAPGQSPAVWSVKPAMYVVDERGDHIDSPPVPAMEAAIVRIPDEDWRYAGQSALHIQGVMDSRCGMLEIPLPFSPPQPSGGTVKESGRLHPLQGYLYRAGFIESVSIEIQNKGDPVTLCLVFENDAGGFYTCDFPVGSAPGAWYLHTYADSQYHYVPDKLIRSAVKFDWLRLVAIELRSPRLQSALEKNSAKTAIMTSEEKHVWWSQPAPVSKPLEKVDLVIRRVQVKQEFPAAEEKSD